MTTKIKKQTLYNKTKQVLQKEGVLTFLKQVASFFGRRIYTNYETYLYDEVLDNYLKAPPHRIDNLIIKPVYIPTMNQIEYEEIYKSYDLKGKFFDFPSYPGAIEYMPGNRNILKEGILIFYGTVNGEFVTRCVFVLDGKETAYNKLYNKIKHPFYSINDKQTIYRGLMVTNPKYSRKGVWKHVFAETHNFLKREGFHKLVYTENVGRSYLMKVLDEMDATAKFKLNYILLFRHFEFIKIRKVTRRQMEKLMYP